MKKFKVGLYLFGASGIVLLAGLFTHPVAVLAQAVKATLIRSVDEPGRQPYSETISFKLDGGIFCNTHGCQVLFAEVPAGKRLVITKITGRLQLSGHVTQPITVFLESLSYVNGVFANAPAYFFLPVEEQGFGTPVPYPGGEQTWFYIIDQPMQAYVEIGRPVMALSVYPFEYTDPAYPPQPYHVQTFTLSGYYVDIP